MLSSMSSVGAMGQRGWGGFTEPFYLQNHFLSYSLTLPWRYPWEETKVFLFPFYFPLQFLSLASLLQMFSLSLVARLTAAGAVFHPSQHLQPLALAC